MSKAVFITGVSSGFGKVTAEMLSNKGYRVYGTSRKGTVDGTLPYTVLKMDVRDRQSVDEAVRTVLGNESGIDVLVNNAGISALGPLEESTIDDIHNLMDTNLYGVLRVCQAVLPGMRSRRSGKIINIGSIGGLLGLPFRGAYTASKFALEGLTESLSMEVKPFGITVCIVEPGDFNTDIDKNRTSITLSDTSPYRKTNDSLQSMVREQMAKAPDPDPVAEAVYRIIQTPKPSLRYKVGSIVEKLSVVLRLIMPSRSFENILMGFYKLKD